MASFAARARNAVAHYRRTGSLRHAVVRLVNKTPLGAVSRTVVDLAQAGPRRARLDLPPLTQPAAPAMLADLRTRGWTPIPADWIAAGLPALQQAADAALELSAGRDPARYKAIWDVVSDRLVATGQLNPGHPAVQFALNPAVTALAAHYLGEAPWLRYVLLTQSYFAGVAPTYSQLWHRDYDDKRMLKLFVYLSDVEGPADGPFTLLEADASARVRNSFFSRHLEDEEVFARIDAAAPRPMYGPKGSCFLVDTSRLYHFGSRLHAGRTRYLYTALYTAWPGIYPGAKPLCPVGPDADPAVRRILAPG